jgi:hypothetical protein
MKGGTWAMWLCEVRSMGKTAKTQRKKGTVASSKKKWTMMNPIWRWMKKCNPSSGHNGQLVHWWMLVHFGPFVTTALGYMRWIVYLGTFEVEETCICKVSRQHSLEIHRSRLLKKKVVCHIIGLPFTLQ